MTKPVSDDKGDEIPGNAKDLVHPDYSPKPSTLRSGKPHKAWSSGNTRKRLKGEVEKTRDGLAKKKGKKGKTNLNQPPVTPRRILENVGNTRREAAPTKDDSGGASNNADSGGASKPAAATGDRTSAVPTEPPAAQPVLTSNGTSKPAAATGDRTSAVPTEPPAASDASSSRNDPTGSKPEAENDDINEFEFDMVDAQDDNGDINDFEMVDDKDHNDNTAGEDGKFRGSSDKSLLVIETVWLTSWCRTIDGNRPCAGTKRRETSRRRAEVGR